MAWHCGSATVTRSDSVTTVFTTLGAIIRNVLPAALEATCTAGHFTESAADSANPDGIGATVASDVEHVLRN
jgi:hypothetical protein